MPRKKANSRPENNVRVTTELPPQSRSTRIAGESAAQFPRVPAAHDGTSATNTDLRNRGAFFRHYEVQEEWDRASPYFRHYVANPPSYFALAAYREALRAGLPPPLVYDAPRHERATKAALTELARGALAEQAAVAAEASGSFVAGAAEEPLLSDAPLPKTRKRVRAEDSEKTDPLEWHCIGKRQKTESSAVADEESSAVAGGVLRSGGHVVGKGRSPPWWRAVGLHVSRGTEGG